MVERTFINIYCFHENPGSSYTPLFIWRITHSYALLNNVFSSALLLLYYVRSIYATLPELDQLRKGLLCYSCQLTARYFWNILLLATKYLHRILTFCIMY